MCLRLVGPVANVSGEQICLAISARVEVNTKEPASEPIASRLYFPRGSGSTTLQIVIASHAASTTSGSTANPAVGPTDTHHKRFGSIDFQGALATTGRGSFFMFGNLRIPPRRSCLLDWRRERPPAFLVDFTAESLGCLLR